MILDTGMNLPNLLTLLRIFFVPLLVATLLADDLSARWQGLIPAARDLFALAIFLAAAATDLLDGYLARRWGQVTTVGTLLDPDRRQAADLRRADLAGGDSPRAGVDRDPDHRARVRGLRAALDRGSVRLHHPRQRTGQDQNGRAGGRDFAGDRAESAGRSWISWR